MKVELPKLYNIGPREWEFYKQRQVQGFSDDETWSLDVTISQFILPRLKRFKEIEFSHPSDIKNQEWNKALDDMIFAFEFNVNEFNVNKFDKNYDIIQKEMPRVKRGLKLFAKYYFDLWW